MYRCSNCGHLLETEELLHAHMEECEECTEEEHELYSLVFTMTKYSMRGRVSSLTRNLGEQPFIIGCIPSVSHSHIFDGFHYVIHNGGLFCVFFLILYTRNLVVVLMLERQKKSRLQEDNLLFSCWRKELILYRCSFSFLFSLGPFSLPF